jgi:hypothetical protein
MLPPPHSPKYKALLMWITLFVQRFTKKKIGDVMTDTNETEAGEPSQPSHREVSPMAEPIPMEVHSRKSTSLRGIKFMFHSPIVVDKIDPRRPFTRAASKKNVPMKSDVEEIST